MKRMVNDRKVRVGQVRMFTGFPEDDCWEESMYVVTSIQGEEIEVLHITGRMSGEEHDYLISHLAEDVVVM